MAKGPELGPGVERVDCYIRLVRRGDSVGVQDCITVWGWVASPCGGVEVECPSKFVPFNVHHI